MKTSIQRYGTWALVSSVILFLAACSTTNTATSNKVSEMPAPKILVNNAIADFTVGEKIEGQGCAAEYLYLFNGGDTSFLERYGDGGSDLYSKAKAAAAYKALNGEKLTTDILVAPTFEIVNDRVMGGFISDSYCVKVIGYRGKINGFKSDPRTFTTTGSEVKVDGVLWGLFGSKTITEEKFVPAPSQEVIRVPEAVVQIQPGDNKGKSKAKDNAVNINVRVINCAKTTC
jgi:hypothetical protein